MGKMSPCELNQHILLCSILCHILQKLCCQMLGKSKEKPLAAGFPKGTNFIPSVVEMFKPQRAQKQTPVLHRTQIKPPHTHGCVYTPQL